MEVERVQKMMIERIIIDVAQKTIIIDFGTEGTDTFDLPDTLFEKLKEFLKQHYKEVEDGV